MSETQRPPSYFSAINRSLLSRTKSWSSFHTLRTIPRNEPSPSRPHTPSELSPLLPSSQGDVERKPRRPLLTAFIKLSIVFVFGVGFLAATLWLALPRLEEADRPLLRIPKSFEQLQALNGLLKKYKTIYPVRTVVCFVVTYLFLQAFSLPGSMYLSILAGAVWGMAIALPLCCACVASGATLCYLISAALGPALLALPKWKARIDRWAEKVDAQRANLMSFLIVLRIAPFPPHWVVNVVCPHLGIGLVPFWFSTFFGMMGVTVIHTTIGGGLDQMTSAKDFHLISWRNFLGLSAIVVGVLIPVGMRYYWRDTLQSVAQTEEELEEEEEEEEGDILLDAGQITDRGKGVVVLYEDEAEFLDDVGSDGDEGFPFAVGEEEDRKETALMDVS